MTKKMFAYVMKSLSKMPPKTPIDPIEEMIYSAVMSKWDDRIAVGALLEVLKFEEWRPCPAKMRRYAMGLFNVAPNIEEAGHAHRVISDIVRLYSTEELRNTYLSKKYPMLESLVDYLGGWGEIGARSYPENRRMIEKYMMQNYIKDADLERPDESKFVTSLEYLGILAAQVYAVCDAGAKAIE